MFAERPQNQKPSMLTFVVKMMTLLIALGGTIWLIVFLKANPSVPLFQMFQ